MAEAALRSEHPLSGLQLLGRGRLLVGGRNRSANDREQSNRTDDTDQTGGRFWYSLQPVRHRRGIYHV